MKIIAVGIAFLALSLSAVGPGARPAIAADSCQDVVHLLNERLYPKIDEVELVTVLRALNESENSELPLKFVTKKQAQKLGWKPGRNLWAYKRLRGKSIGGDVFSNREGALPNGGRRWHEADLDYRGGHRGGKRIVFSNDGLREVTVDHYNSFTEIPPCR